MRLCLSTQIPNLHSSRNKTDKSHWANYSSHRTRLSHSLLLSSFCSECPALIGIHYWFQNMCVHKHYEVHVFIHLYYCVILSEYATNFGLICWKSSQIQADNEWLYCHSQDITKNLGPKCMLLPDGLFGNSICSAYWVAVNIRRNFAFALT